MRHAKDFYQGFNRYIDPSVLVFSAPLKFKVATVPKSGLPPEFKYHGLRNLPAIIHGEEVRVGPTLDIARLM